MFLVADFSIRPSNNDEMLRRQKSNDKRKEGFEQTFKDYNQSQLCEDGQRNENDFLFFSQMQTDILPTKRRYFG
jgi:hypothetical protein